jgi:hypothetical protein
MSLTTLNSPLQVPNVQVSVHIARLLRFFSLYFEDLEKLRLYLGVISDRAKESTEEYIFLFKVCVNVSLCISRSMSHSLCLCLSLSLSVSLSLSLS